MEPCVVVASSRARPAVVTNCERRRVSQVQRIQRNGREKKKKKTHEDGATVEGDVETTATEAYIAQLVSVLQRHDEDVCERSNEGGDSGNGGNSGKSLSLGKVGLPDRDDEGGGEVDIRDGVDGKHGDSL
jgi:hypothetical protein